MKDTIPDIISTTVLVAIPAVRYSIGNVSMAPPTIELNIARDVLRDEFLFIELSTSVMLYIKYGYLHTNNLQIDLIKKKQKVDKSNLSIILFFKYS